jgi:hypothetical protein
VASSFIALIAVILEGPAGSFSQPQSIKHPIPVNTYQLQHTWQYPPSLLGLPSLKPSGETLLQSAIMADLEAELLALAGGDESSADERSSSPKPKPPSPQRHPHPHSRSLSPADMARKGTAKVIKKPRRRPVNSDDDGEV